MGIAFSFILRARVCARARVCVRACGQLAPVRCVVSHLAVVKVPDIGVVKVGDFLLARHRVFTREASLSRAWERREKKKVFVCASGECRVEMFCQYSPASVVRRATSDWKPASVKRSPLSWHEEAH